MAGEAKKDHLDGLASPDRPGALQAPPVDALVPARIVLTRRSFEEVVQRLRAPGQPTQELRDLMGGGRDRTTRGRD